MAEGKETGVAPDPQYRVAADGAFVYPNRCLPLPVFFAALSCYLVTTMPTFSGLLLSVPLMYLWYDIYSGLVHINLDDPRNLAGYKAVILFQGCLEFQWHHSIPSDIVDKTLLASCADINVVVMIGAAVNCVLFGMTAGTGAALTGLKLLFAYFGQHCHREAHKGASKRSALTQRLQDWGIMLHQDKHRNHHKPPHDGNFCLVGYCDFLINFILNHVTTNDHLLFGIWLLATLFDIVAFQWVLVKLAPSLFT